MSASGVPIEAITERASAARDRFQASGTSISDWARARGFSISLVQSVLAGKRACLRGESHAIAVALGIKAQVAPPGPLPVEHPAAGGGEAQANANAQRNADRSFGEMEPAR